jgi:hypothetical protein
MINSLKLLCPNHHLIAGTVYDAEAMTLGEVKDFLEQELPNMIRSGRCPNCQSEQKTWQYQTEATNFADLNEASASLLWEHGESLDILEFNSCRNHPDWRTMLKARNN